MTGTGVDMVRCTLGLLAVLVWACPVPAQSEPQLRFTSPTEFQVHSNQRLWSRGVGQRYHDAGRKYRYFARLTARQATDGTLTFAAEGQTGPGVTYCHWEACGTVSVGVLSGAEGGLLYLGVDIEHSGTQIRSRFEDFPAQRVEVSVRAGQQQVYQEVRVTAPADGPECGDYPARNEDRYRCYFTREIIAPAFREADSPLVAGLPGQLVQDRGEYGVVFAEEFAGTYASFETYDDNCDRGLAALDRSKWNTSLKHCRPNPEGPPCGYLEGGSLHLSVTSQCNAETRTWGSFQPRYGYVEVRYTINSRSSHSTHSNLNMLMGDLSRTERYLLRTHNLELDSLERLLTLVPWVEIDLIENEAKHRAVFSHQYRNWYPTTHHPDVRPMLTYKLRAYCQGYYVAEQINTTACRDASRITITEGMEWTPGGYLFLRQVQGRDDTLQIIDKKHTRIAETRVRKNGKWVFGNEGDSTGARHYLSGPAKEQYFVQLDPDDPAFYLEAVGISHAPKPIHIGSWSTHYADLPATNHSKLTFDYIRVFQPRNHYADMEPLYQ